MSKIAEAKLRIISAAVALVITLVALFTVNDTFAWFATNEAVDAGGMEISVKNTGVFEEVNYYRVTDISIFTDTDGTKHNIYNFSYSPEAIDTTERTDFTTPVRMHPYSDLSGNCQVLIEVVAPSTEAIRLMVQTLTTEYLGNTISAAITAGRYDIDVTNLPLTSVVKYALIDSVEVDSTNQMLVVHEHEIYEHERYFISFDTNGKGAFNNPGADGFIVTPNSDRKFYILVDYDVKAVADINAKILEYAAKAVAADATFDDIVIGKTNLLFAADFDFEKMEEN